MLKNFGLIQTLILFFLSAFIKRYQVSRIRNQTKLYWMIQTIKSSQLAPPNGTSEMLLERWVLVRCSASAVGLNSAGSTFDTWQLPPPDRLLPWCCVNSTKNKRGKGVVCACNKQSAAKAAVPGCSMQATLCSRQLPITEMLHHVLGPQKNKSKMQFFQHLVACKLFNHGMIQPFKNSTSYV